MVDQGKPIHNKSTCASANHGRCGKSVLAASLIQNLRVQHSTGSIHDTIPTIYYLVDSREESTTNTETILASLVAQLLTLNRDCTDHVYQQMIDSGQYTRCGRNRLVALLSDLINTLPRVALVIDAVDESDDPLGVLSPLLELCTATQGSNVHLFLFSRSSLQISDKVSGVLTREITTKDTRQDLETYVEAALNRKPLSNLVDEPDLGQRIFGTLTSPSHGLFLWVKLMIDTLERQLLLRDIIEALDNLPKGLDEVYGRLLSPLLLQSDKNREAARHILAWLCVAPSALTLSQLGKAIAVRQGDNTEDQGARVLDLSGMLRKFFGPLIAISEDSQTVTFVHITIKEFLMQPLNAWSQSSDLAPLKAFHIDPEWANAYVSSTCITYMSYDCFRPIQHEKITSPGGSSKSVDFINGNELYEYCMRYWADHLTQSGIPSTDLLSLVHRFVNSSGVEVWYENISQKLSKDQWGQKTNDLDTVEITSMQFKLNRWLQQSKTWATKDYLASDIIEQIHSRILKQRAHRYGPEHLKTLQSKNTLAQLYFAQSRAKDALPLYLAVCEGFQRILGADDIETCRALVGLGDAYSTMSQHDTAEKHIRIALLALQRTLSPDDPAVLKACERLALVLSRIKQGPTNPHAEELRKLRFRVYDGRLRTLGPEHLETLKAMLDWGQCLRRFGDTQEAERMITTSLEIRKRILGPKHPVVLDHKKNYALLLSGTGRKVEAVEILRECLSVQEELFGIYHNDYLRTITNMAGTLRQLGEGEKGPPGALDEAEGLARTVIDIRTKLHGAQSSDCAEAILAHANILLALGRLFHAREQAKNALQIFTTCPLDIIRTSGVQRTANKLVDVLRKENRLREADNVSKAYLKQPAGPYPPQYPGSRISLEYFQAFLVILVALLIFYVLLWHLK